MLLNAIALNPGKNYATFFMLGRVSAILLNEYSDRFIRKMYSDRIILVNCLHFAQTKQSNHLSQTFLKAPDIKPLTYQSAMLEPFEK